MSIVRISVRLLSWQRSTEQYLTLDGLPLGLRFRLSGLEDRWYSWVLAQDSAVITGPLKLVPGIDLFAGRKHDPRVPPGELFVSSSDRLPPTNATIDSVVKLLYRGAA